MNKPMRLVRVVWEDASVADPDTWVMKEGLKEPEVMIFQDVGWLLDLTADHILLSASMGREIMGPRLRIPAGMIRSIHEYDINSGKAMSVPKKRTKKAA
jgi:hypothetical protein